MAYDILWKIHGILMASSLLSMSAGITFSLLRKGKKRTFSIHRGLESYAAISGVTAILTAFVMVQIYSGAHLAGIHGILGLVVFLLLLCTPALMILKKTKKRKALRKLHKVLGFLTLFLMMINIYSGLSMMGIL